MIDAQLIRAVRPSHPAPEIAAAKLQAAALHWDVTTPRQVAMLIAQLAHESNLVPVQENLNYRAARIAQVWPGRFPTVESALPFAFNPQALANKVYGERGGNTGPDDGWRYSGKGMLQLTFLGNYALYQKRTGFPIVAQPELMLQYGVSSEVAGAFWQEHSLNAAAERGDVRAVTLAINGGLIGLDDREQLYQRARASQSTRLGLVGAPLELDPITDASADLDLRAAEVERVLNLLTA